MAVSESQIFISYARDDDAQPPNVPEAKGFVTFLHDMLHFEFTQLGHPRPKIWRDTTGGVDLGQQFEPVIDKAIAASSILLVVMSRNWLDRPYCQRELTMFAERWRAGGELSVRNRIVVVNKHNILPHARPALLQGQVGYSFFSPDETGDAALEQEYFTLGKIRDDRYWDRLRQLANYLRRITVDLSPKSAASVDEPQSHVQSPGEPSHRTGVGRTIYLAKPALDMRMAYDSLVKELSGRGFTLVPDPAKDIPNDLTAVEFIDEALALSEISVHLLGDNRGYAPDETEPIVKLQLARAAAGTNSVKVQATGVFRRRIIWAPKILERAETAVEREPLLVLARFDELRATDLVEGGSLASWSNSLDTILRALLHDTTTQRKSRRRQMFMFIIKLRT